MTSDVMSLRENVSIKKVILNNFDSKEKENREKTTE